MPTLLKCFVGTSLMSLVIRLLCLSAGFFLAVRPAQAQALVRMPDDVHGQSIQAADPHLPATPAEDKRLIDAYIREAGQLGPRRFFSSPKVVLHATIGEAYDDNILVSAAREKEADSVTTLGGGVVVTVGEAKEKKGSYALGEYQATATLFGIHGEEDAVDQSALAEVQYRWDKLAVRATGSFQSLHETSPDLGQRTQRNVFDEALDLKYSLGAYTRIQGGLRYDYSDYDGPIDTQDASATLGADYLFFDKLRLGGGFVYGHTEANGGVHEDYEQLEARIEYEVTGEIKVSSRIGLEVRERSDGAETNPVFALEGEWTPFDGTALHLSGFRRVTASASLAGDDILETGLHFSIRQRLVSRFYVLLDAQYTHAQYRRATDAVSSGPREDDYYFLRGAVGYDFVDWCKAQVFCQRRQDDSTREQFSFDSTRGGVQIDLAY